MSIKFRLIVLYTLILVFVFVLFGSAVYLISKATLLNEVDRGLNETAVQLRERTEAFVMGNVAVLSLPAEELDVFQTATNFFVILDTRGEILTKSQNLGDYDTVLDPDGHQEKALYNTVVHNDQSLRVLTEPLFVQGEDGRRLVGYLQVARLLENEAVLDQLQFILLLTGLAAVGLSLILGALLTHQLLKPLDDITAVALKITRTDDLSRRLPDSGRRDEIGRLTMVLNQTLERLERLFHARQRFLADVSHELRTPLTTIRGNVDLIRRMGEADPETMDVVEDELLRMTRLVDDLLLLARADTGGLPIQQKPVELDSLFLDVYRQVGSLDQGVAVELLEVDQVCVLGDQDRLKQLILNLVDNAVKYTPAGGKVTMSLSKANGLAEIVITDTGIGIPDDDLPRIFDRFYRVDKARSRNMGGSGLGLSIAYWIALAHRGDIEVTSKVGAGSVFRITLPVLSTSEQKAAALPELATRPVVEPGD
ncbi:MAG: HAMP domain-containing protein [Chloroflexota bacterium]|nr:MAG: HAMP domain-containing protein [Chloroflexota bacterium]